MKTGGEVHAATDKLMMQVMKDLMPAEVQVADARWTAAWNDIFTALNTAVDAGRSAEREEVAAGPAKAAPTVADGKAPQKCRGYNIPDAADWLVRFILGDPRSGPVADEMNYTAGHLKAVGELKIAFDAGVSFAMGDRQETEKADKAARDRRGWAVERALNLLHHHQGVSNSTVLPAVRLTHCHYCGNGMPKGCDGKHGMHDFYEGFSCLLYHVHKPTFPP